MTKTSDITQHNIGEGSNSHSNVNNTPVYIFLHMPKCAGTTFRVHIENNLNPDEALELYSNKNSRFKKRDNINNYICSLLDERKSKLKLIYGHQVYYGIHKLLGREGKYFTFLRDPVPRTISFYNYGRQNNSWSNIIQKKYIDKGITPSLEQWLQDSPWVWNEAMGFFADYEFCQRKMSYTPEEIDELLDKFFFIGLTETFDNDALFIFNLLGIHLQVFKTQNVSQQYFKHDQLEQIRDNVATNNQYDLALYKKAAERHIGMSMERAYRIKVAQMKLVRAVSPINRNIRGIIGGK